MGRPSDRSSRRRSANASYAGSGPTSGPGSIVRDAADCAALLAALRAEPAHVVGVSYSGAVRLTHRRACTR